LWQALGVKPSHPENRNGTQRQRGGRAKLTGGLVYKEYRIHSPRLASGLCVSIIVKLGRKKVMTKDALTPAVTRVPGEYDTEEEAVRSAKRYIGEDERRLSAEAAD
jgi:hypothetical protein